MEKLKRFFSTTIIYFAGTVFSKLVVFFLLPLYTAKIAPVQYGMYDLVMACVNLFVPLFFLQIWDGMFRATFDFPTNEEKYSVMSNAMTVCLLGAILYMVLFFVFQLAVQMDYAIYICAYGLTFSLQYMYGYVCRAFLDNKLYAITGLVNTVLTAAINIVLIVVFDWDVKSLYLAPTIGMVVQILIIEFKYKVLGHFRVAHISKTKIVQMIRFSLPLCFAAISYWLLTGFSKLLIMHMLGPAENGFFGIAHRLSSMVVLIITIFQYAWNELAYLMSNDEKRMQTYNVCVDLLMKFAILGSAGICLFIKIIFPYFIHEQYSLAFYIIPATMIGSVLNSLASFIGVLFMTEKKTNSIMYSTILAAVINVVFGLVFTKIWGLHGATIALLLAFAVLALARVLQSKKQLHIDYKLRNSIWLILVLAGAVVEYYLIHNIIIDICAIVVVLGLFCLSVRKYFALIFKNSGVFIKGDSSAE